MKTMKELNKEFTKDIIRRNGLPETLEEALEHFDKVAGILDLLFVSDIDTVGIKEKIRNYLISLYKSLED